ncbi:MAG: agmatinase, partial [Dehalococcoidia bacterium]
LPHCVMEGSLTHRFSQPNQAPARLLRPLGWEERPDEAPLSRAAAEGPGEGAPVVTNDREQLFPADWQDAARYAAPYSFMRLPLSRELRYADVAIVGVPFDLGVNMRPGARFGPRGIRNGSFQIRQYPMKAEDLWGPFRTLRVVDYGDLNLVNAYIDTAVGQIEEQMTPVFEAGVIPISLGGDHTVTLPILRACAKRHGPVALVHFDAHPDFWAPPAADRPYHHGTVFHIAAHEGLIDLERSVQVGIRGTISAMVVEDARRAGFELLTADQFFELGVAATIGQIQARATGKVYVSLDIDAADPAFAPGTGTPEVAGLSSRELVALVRGLRGLEIVGCDVVEVSPPWDSSEITALLAANLVYEFLEVLAARR